MNLIIRKPYRYLLLASIMIALALGFVRISDIFILKTISISPENYSSRLDMSKQPAEQNIFKMQPAGLISNFFDNDDVLKIDVDYNLPDGIEIEINNIKPLALIVGSDNSSLYRLDDNGHILPLDRLEDGFNYPVITGLGKYKLYKKNNNDRLYLVVDQLNLLKDNEIDFYLTLATIDLSHDDYISVWIDGLSTELLMYAGDLYQNMRNLKVFLLDFNPDLCHVRRLDLRSEGMIIAVG